MTKATKLKAYDEKAEEILKRDSYIGRGSGGPNIGNKLKLVSAHLLGKYAIDHNTFAEVIPGNYKRIDINFDDYEKLIEASSSNVASKVPKSRVAKAKEKLTKKRTIHISEDEDETPPAKRPTRLEFSSPPASQTPACDVTTRPPCTVEPSVTAARF